MPAPSRRALHELDRRRALAHALWYEQDLDRYTTSAHRFIRRLPDGYKSALSRYLGVEAPNGVLDAMKAPSFWRWGVVYRLCLWGWSPDTDSNDGATSITQNDGGGAASGDSNDDGGAGAPRTLMPSLREIDHTL
jgi:hypothetical protein